LSGCITDDDRDYVTQLHILKELVEDSKNFAARQRASYEVCDEHKDIATANLLGNLSIAYEREF
jgi:starvation-inducible DNA-binding protein